MNRTHLEAGGAHVPAPRAELDMAQLEDITARDGFAVYDPTTTGGFRALTDTERALLTPSARLDERAGPDGRAEFHEHLAASEQRAEAARVHLARERERAEQAGDPDRAAIAGEGLRVLDEETARDLRTDPRIPSRAELDELYARGEATGWNELTARAWEYADSRRDIADERAAAVEAGDTDTVARLDDRHALLDHHYLGTTHPQPEARAEHTEAQHAAQDPVTRGVRAGSEVETALADAQLEADLADRPRTGDPGPARDVADLEALADLRPLPDREAEADGHAEVEVLDDAEADDEWER